MQTRAKLQTEIIALAAEVKEVARRRGRSLPTPEDLADLLSTLDVDWEAIRAAREPGEGQGERIVAVFTPGEVAPGAQALREAYLRLLECALRADRPGYQQALRALGPVLCEVLARREGAWKERWEEAARHFALYRGACHWLRGLPTPSTGATGTGLTPAAWAIQTAAQAGGWQRVLLTGLALTVAATELREWREWMEGGAVARHDQLRQESRDVNTASDPAAVWAREVARHTLPEDEEAALVQQAVVSAEQLAAVKALPPIPPRNESTNPNP